MKRWSELGRRKQEDKRIGRVQEGREVRVVYLLLFSWSHSTLAMLSNLINQVALEDAVRRRRGKKTGMARYLRDHQLESSKDTPHTKWFMQVLLITSTQGRTTQETQRRRGRRGRRERRAAQRAQGGEHKTR